MGLGFRAEAWGLGVWGLRFTVSFWLGVQGLGCGGLGFRVQGLS